MTSINQANGDQPDQAPVDYNVSAYENYIYNAFLFPVNKAEALGYLDHGGPKPQRFAKVIAIRGANNPPDVMEYKVDSASSSCSASPAKCESSNAKVFKGY